MCFSHHLTRTSWTSKRQKWWFCCNCDGDAWDSEMNSHCAVSDQLCPHTEPIGMIFDRGCRNKLVPSDPWKPRLRRRQDSNLVRLKRRRHGTTWDYMGLQNKVGWMPRYYFFILNIHSLPPEWRNHTFDCCWCYSYLFMLLCYWMGINKSVSKRKVVGFGAQVGGIES